MSSCMWLLLLHVYYKHVNITVAYVRITCVHVNITVACHPVTSCCHMNKKCNALYVNVNVHDKLLANLLHWWNLQKLLIANVLPYTYYIILYILYSTVSVQQMDLLPENAPHNNTIFARSIYRRYGTTSQCLSSYGCAITMVYIYIYTYIVQYQYKKGISVTCWWGRSGWNATRQVNITLPENLKVWKMVPQLTLRNA